MDNTLRRKIGLKPIQKSWKPIKIDGIYDKLFISEKNVIEKSISLPTDITSYSESDLSIQMNGEGKMITKTGKIKNLTFSVYESIKPIDICISITENEIRISNHLNNLMMIDEYDLNLKSLSEGFDFIDNYLDDDSNYFKKHFEDFKTAKKTSRLKIKTGDIFRVPIKNKKFIYGQVISPLRKIAKTQLPVLGGFDTSELKINVFDPNPFYLPVWVRFFLIKTENPELKEREFNKIETSKSTIIGDYSLRHSNYQKIGNCQINLDEIDVPMEVGTKFDEASLFHYFNWGAGIVTIKVNKEIEKLISENELNYPNKLRERQHKSIETFIDKCKEKKHMFGGLHSSKDLRDDNLKELKNLLFKTMGLEQAITYNEFAKQNGFMSINEIVELNK